VTANLYDASLERKEEGLADGQQKPGTNRGIRDQLKIQNHSCWDAIKAYVYRVGSCTRKVLLVCAGRGKVRYTQRFRCTRDLCHMFVGVTSNTNCNGKHCTFTVT